MASGYDDFKTTLVEITKDKYMKRVVQILVTILIMLLIYAVGDYVNDCHHNRHAKFFYGLLECNIPKDHPDTVWIPSPIVYQNIYKDTCYPKNKNPTLGAKSVPNVSISSTNQKDHAQTAQTINNNTYPK